MDMKTKEQRIADIKSRIHSSQPGSDTEKNHVGNIVLPGEPGVYSFNVEEAGFYNFVQTLFRPQRTLSKSANRAERRAAASSKRKGGAA